jgi:hypothetical protein
MLGTIISYPTKGYVNYLGAIGIIRGYVTYLRAQIGYPKGNISYLRATISYLRHHVLSYLGLT